MRAALERRSRRAAQVALIALLSASSGLAAPQSAARTTQPAPAEPPEARSLLGPDLFAAPAGSRPEAEKQLAEAEAEFARDPGLEQRIWVGRRQAYLWRMRAAIETFSQGLREQPQAAALYRHRGHRYISVRDFDAAIADLRRAAELIAGKPDVIEPDGQPNRLNKPLSTLGFNVWYHLGLAQYLKGDFRGALAAYGECMKFSQDYADKRVATSYWMYLTYCRLGQRDEARKLAATIAPDLEIIENEAYHALLLLFNGTKSVDELLKAEERAPTDSATIAYGVGMWRLLRGDEAQALTHFEAAVAGSNWPAFGFIAAEVELARRRAAGARPE